MVIINPAKTLLWYLPRQRLDVNLLAQANNCLPLSCRRSWSLPRDHLMIKQRWLPAVRRAFSRPSPGFFRVSHRRQAYTKPDDIKPEASEKARSRVVRITSRLPKFLQRYTTPLINAPLTHISAFLLLHELTAVVPLFGLAATFHYTRWMPPFISEGKWVSDGVEKFGNYFRRKGWLGEEGKAKRHKWWGRGEGGTRLVIE